MPIIVQQGVSEGLHYPPGPPQAGPPSKPKPCTLILTLVDKKTRKPLAGYQISFQTSSSKESPAYTDERGQMNVTNLVCGEKYTIKYIDYRFARSGIFPQMSEGLLTPPITKIYIELSTIGG